MSPETRIAAIILAAGLSTRMGSPKMLLPWKGETVLESVIKALMQSPADPIFLVYGAFQDQILEIIRRFPVHPVFNPQFANGSMLISLQTGLRELPETCDGFLVVLGDQPFISGDLIQKIILDYENSKAKLVIPSHNHRRGHPWLIDISLKNEILGLEEPQTLRDFLTRYENEIKYLVVEDPRILEDMDTREDYDRLSAMDQS